MIAPKGNPNRRYTLFFFGIILLLSGVVVNLIYLNSFLLRTIGLLLLVIGVLLIRASNVRGLMGIRATNTSCIALRTHKRPGPLAWTVSVVSVAGLVIFYICMLRADHAGGHAVWPVYAFGACGIVATIACGYLAAKFFG